MLVDQLKSGVILCGPSFPEPAQVILVAPLGQSIKLIPFSTRVPPEPVPRTGRGLREAFPWKSP
jgi:hypothetical protein